MQLRALPSLFLLVLLSSTATALAQEKSTTAEEAPAEGTLIAYVDDAGRLHVVNSLEMVPQQYRDRARPAQLGEVSTLSSGKKARSSRGRRSNSKAATQRPRRDKAESEGQSVHRTKGKTKSARERDRRRLAELKKVRVQVLDELALLDEGWLPPDGNEKSDNEPSEGELESRVDALSKKLRALDEEIGDLQAKK
jgi:hypothetical protein